jgi:ribulose kinase
LDQNLLLAVDVGTASARAGVLSATGELLARAECPIEMRRFGTRLAEQNSEQIWQAVCLAVRTAMAQANAKPHNVVGLGFDATCSLVVRDGDGAPLPVSGGVEPHWDTIVWFDHRAHIEAKECTATRHQSLLDVGGIMSPEMEVPKLMWLKRHVPATWAHARQRPKPINARLQMELCTAKQHALAQWICDRNRP